MENTARFCAIAYNEAYELFGTDRHVECVHKLEAMTYDPNLPLWFVMQVHGCLADAIDEPWLVREHLARAEEAYDEILRRWPEDMPGQERLHENLRKQRAAMDDTNRFLAELPAEEDEEVGDDSEGEEASLKDEAGTDPLDIGVGDLEKVPASEASSQEPGDSQATSAPAQQFESQSTVGSPLVARPMLSPITPRSRMAGPSLRIPMRGTPTSASRPPASGSSSPIKRYLEEDEDTAPESPTKKGRSKQ